MKGRSAGDRFADLEIRIFQQQDARYPVEITLGRQQEFPRGYLAADILPWVSSSDPAADGQYLTFGSREKTVRIWNVMARNPNALSGGRVTLESSTG